MEYRKIRAKIWEGCPGWRSEFLWIYLLSQFTLLLEASALPSQSSPSGCKVEKRMSMKTALVPTHSQFLGLLCFKERLPQGKQS